MKKILMSLAMIAAVSAIVIGATGAFFSDTEKTTGNTFSVGTIDISVDGENPWHTAWLNYLDKPSQTNYMNFVIENEGENPAKVWKKISNVQNSGGDATFCSVASSEPEYVEGGGLFDANNGCLPANYVERNNLSAFIIYDMLICIDLTGVNCPFLANDGYGNENKKPDTSTDQWTVLVDEADQVRVDNVVDTWVKLSDGLQPGEKLVVSQSYHLMTWDDSGQPVITNWAQGDEMIFDIELEARQLDAPAPGTTISNGDITAAVQFVQKDPIAWTEIAAPQGSLTYNIAGSSFDYDINVTGLTPNTQYNLIYYADPWPGNNPGALIATYTSDGSGNISYNNESSTPNIDMPSLPDNNYGVGAKLWLVLSSDYSGGQMIAWNPSSYLFDKGLVNYDYQP